MKRFGIDPRFRLDRGSGAVAIEDASSQLLDRARARVAVKESCGFDGGLKASVSNLAEADLRTARTRRSARAAQTRANLGEGEVTWTPDQLAVREGLGLEVKEDV